MSSPFPPQAFFTLFGSFAHCRFTVRCNDIPVCAHDVSGREMHIDMPVNLSLAPGLNALEVTIEPAVVEGVRASLDEVGVSAELALAVRQKGQSYDLARLVGGFSYSAGTLSAVAPDDAAMLTETPPTPVVVQASSERAVFRRVLSLVSPLPTWLWVTARPVVLDDATVAEVVAHYRTVWAAMQRKDVAALRALSDDNAREVAQAYYLGSVDEGHRLIDYEGLVSRPGVRLLPMPTEGLQVELMADGRLVRLVGADGQSAIRVFDDTTGFGGAVSVMYCNVPGRGWVQIR